MYCLTHTMLFPLIIFKCAHCKETLINIKLVTDISVALSARVRSFVHLDVRQVCVHGRSEGYW